MRQLKAPGGGPSDFTLYLPFTNSLSKPKPVIKTYAEPIFFPNSISNALGQSYHHANTNAHTETFTNSYANDRFHAKSIKFSLANGNTAFRPG